MIFPRRGEFFDTSTIKTKQKSLWNQAWHTVWNTRGIPDGFLLYPRYQRHQRGHWLLASLQGVFLANSFKCIFLKMSMNRNIETGHRVYDTLLCTCRVITPGKVIETPCTYVPTCLAKALGSLPTHSVCHLQHRGTSFLTSHHQYFKTS